MTSLEPRMTIGGELVSGQSVHDVLNPADNERCGRAPICSPAQLDEAMNAASNAFPRWADDEDARRKTLLEAADVIASASAELALTTTLEQGKPLSDAQNELKRVIAWLRHFGTLDVSDERTSVDGSPLVQTRRRPIGVVAAITPWNSPLMLGAWKLAPALRAGNTVVLKPSPHTPLGTLRLGELLRPVFPPGVLNIISGGDDLGALMTSHSVPGKVTFTGSIAAGKRVAEAAAPDLKRLTLELGGNDPAIILENADLTEYADSLFWSAFRNCGQVCSAVKRVYVPRTRHAELASRLADVAKSVRVGPGTDDGTQLGPLSNTDQLERVKGLIAEAREEGAQVAAGGRQLERPGNFLEPTILAAATDEMRVVAEEQFGPVLPLVPYDDVQDAIRSANATHYGLSGSVWGRDPQEATRIAELLDCGRIGVNAHPRVSPDEPFGGWKWSGIGVENGLEGLHSYSQIQVMYLPAESSVEGVRL
jgi:acyl-CoA reductase-like NAD-dependent aldehyde dehydrogenase